VYKHSRALFLGATGFGVVNSVAVLRAACKEAGMQATGGPIPRDKM
jgi:hypothetical protein